MGNESNSVVVKFMIISTLKGSEVNLFVRDIQRNNLRKVVSKYALSPRKPMVYGKAVNVRTGIQSVAGKGFRIDNVSFEGSITRRASTR